MTALSRSSNWPRYLVPATTAAMSSDRTRWSRSTSGHWPLAISRARPSTMAVLPTPGSPISTGLFFLRRARISMTRSISLSRPMVGSSWPSAASWVRSRQKWSSAGVLDFFSDLGARLRPAAGAADAGCGHVAAQQPQRLRARLLQVDAGVGEHLRGDALLLAEQAEQQVLGADVGVVELARLGHRQLEHLLGARGVRQVGAGGGGRLSLLDRLLDLLLDVLEVDVEVRSTRGDALALADQAEQDVLGADVLVVQPGRFLARHLEDLPDPVGEVVAVHRVTLRRRRFVAASGVSHEVRRDVSRASARIVERRTPSAPRPGAPAA